MLFFPLSLHRAATLFRLRRLLRTKRAAPAFSPFSPVSGRLLYVAASCLPYHISGYASRTHELLRSLRTDGKDLRVVTRTGYPWDRRDSLGQPEGTSTLIDGISYAHLPTPRNNRVTALYAAQAAAVLERHAKQERVAVIHAASNHVNALPALIAARRLGIPFQYEMRGLWELTRASRQPAFENSHAYELGLELEGLAASHADRVYVISGQLGRYAHERWGIAEDRLHLLPNCVDAERIKPAPAAAVVPHSIGYAGSLIAYEGLDTLIEAVSLLVRGDSQVRLHIMGDGEARPALEAQAAALGLGEYVRFYGKMLPEDARAHLARCALVCIPRRDFAVCRIVPPIKLAEAPALGKAVVVPDLPVFRDELGPEPAGWFFRAGDAEHLAAVLARALADPEQLAAMGLHGRRHILQCRQWRQFTGNVVFPKRDGI